MPDMRYLRHRQRSSTTPDQNPTRQEIPRSESSLRHESADDVPTFGRPSSFECPPVRAFFLPTPLEAQNGQVPGGLASTHVGSSGTGHDRDRLSLDSRLGFWERSKLRAKSDKTSWDYVLRSGLAGGLAGCVAKTAIAPLDRVKILFQTSNADFKRYAGTPLGVYHAIRAILQSSGPVGLFQGHSATLLRIFPYAGIKFMAYERLDGLIMPEKEMRTPGRLFLAGSLAGITSVLFTYPLELIRVRLAFQTKKSDRSSLREVIRQLYIEGHPLHDSPPGVKASTAALPSATSLRPSHILARIPIINAFIPFYRGFSITIIGMIPYAGVSFLTYGTLKRHAPEYSSYLAEHKTFSDLACGSVAGAVSQTASYPFEVVRRRMQVGGLKGMRTGVTWQEAVRTVYKEGAFRGFFVGLSIGYVKVIPMTSISFAVWQMAKRAMDIG